MKYHVYATKGAAVIDCDNIEEAERLMGASRESLRRRCAKHGGGQPFEFDGWTVTATRKTIAKRRKGYKPIKPATPDGCYALTGGKVFTAKNFPALERELGVPNGSIYKCWLRKNRPATFAYQPIDRKVIHAGLGPYTVPVALVPAMPERSVLRREVEFIEDRIAPRRGGLLSAGYAVHGLGAAGR